MLCAFPAKVWRTTQFYHNHNIHNNENTGQTAHSAYARNATPSAKMAISSGFGVMLSLFNDAGLPRLPCLIHHSPPVGRAISVCRRKRRQIAICGRFPDPVRCVCWHCLLTKPDAYPTHGRSACCSGWFASWPGSQDGQRMSQTDFSDSLQPAGHCDRVSPNPDNAHAVEVLQSPANHGAQFCGRETSFRRI